MQSLRILEVMQVKLGKLRIRVLVIMVMLLCSTTNAAEVKLYAAASLTDVLTELSSTFEKKYPEIRIKKSFAGSSTLAKQITNGAPADVFIAADSDWVNYVKERGILDKTSIKKLLSNELVLIAPLESKVIVLVDPAFDLSTAFEGRLCTGDPASVPAGKYAKQSLAHYTWWNKIQSRLVGTEDARAALAFVERAECGLGIVYKTDAMVSRKVKIVATFPSVSHAPIEYPGALIKTANVEAKSFWSFLQTDEAKSVFARYGFSPAN